MGGARWACDVMQGGRRHDGAPALQQRKRMLGRQVVAHDSPVRNPGPMSHGGEVASQGLHESA